MLISKHQVFIYQYLNPEIIQMTSTSTPEENRDVNVLDNTNCSKPPTSNSPCICKNYDS
jgi:Uma2 family endonuclease